MNPTGFPSRADLDFYKSKQPLPGWAQKLSGHKPLEHWLPRDLIESVVNAHGGIRLTPGEMATGNLLGIVGSMRNRGKDLATALYAISREPGCLIAPQKRASLARKWAMRLSFGSKHWRSE